ncbi:MAG: DNA-binding protein [Deltaproteobacteria bacterium RIFCSPLOWO2_02_FULL_44_10]|nr:MAG: DNA-binding protein [Deltaproteobacteria bacterium RIFCSPHIGHO2_02_FULL_44_16]OGQ45330.1 MAG: DNA-binding protein [Deltaproteobacteria bacterium RIFCSPLOWO2_02_FULL_44_10]
MKNTSLIPINVIANQIYLIRGTKVMLDKDLAKLYGVKTFHLNEAVKRNMERFPLNFMFRLTEAEFGEIRGSGWGGRRTLPYAFTEQGVSMLSSVLRSKRAIQVNIAIMNTFVRLRQMIASHEDIVHKIDAMEKKYDSQFKVVFDALRQMMLPAKTKDKSIGFELKKKEQKQNPLRVR